MDLVTLSKLQVSTQKSSAEATVFKIEATFCFICSATLILIHTEPEHLISWYFCTVFSL